jgi:hypothetical protein
VFVFHLLTTLNGPLMKTQKDSFACNLPDSLIPAT